MTRVDNSINDMHQELENKPTSKFYEEVVSPNTGTHSAVLAPKIEDESSELENKVKISAAENLQDIDAPEGTTIIEPVPPPTQT